MKQRERYEQYLLSRPVKPANFPAYRASVKQVEQTLGAEIDSLLSAGLTQLIDRIQGSNPQFAGVSARQLANLRTAVRRYAEAIGN